MKPLFLKNIKLIHRLNKNLILDPNFQIRSEELVLNGDFSQQGSELISNGDFSQQGSPNWTLGTGWSIVNGKALSIGHSNHTTLIQNQLFLIGKTYKVTFDIVVHSGTFKIQLLGGGNDSGNNISLTQVQYTEYIVPTSNRTSLGIRNNDGNAIGSITNISIVEFGQNWTFDMDVNFQNDKANVNGNGYLFQRNVFSQLKTYQIQYTLSNYQQGRIRYRTGILGSYSSSNQTHTDILSFPPSSNTETMIKMAFRLKEDFIGSIDNISGREIYASWNTLNNFSIDTNQVGFIVCNGRGTLIQNNILEIGTNYEITIHLVNTNNSAQFFIDQLNPIIQTTDTSILKFEFLSTQTYLSLSSENFIGKISQITLIKN